MNLPPRRDERARFWKWIRFGLSPTAAAAAAGVGRISSGRWFRQAGGVVPADVLTQISKRYLSIEDREEIFAGVERNESINAIARAIGRAPSTVQRELRRNMPKQQYRTRSRLEHGRGRPRTAAWEYRPSLAQRRADRSRGRAKPAKLETNLRLRELVQAKLVERLSPEQIAVELRAEFLDDADMWVSHETIYQSIYVQGRGVLRRELAVCLRTGRALRKPRRKGQERRGRIQGMINISERPPEVEDRAVPGHWEGDLIIGKNGKSAIGTLVERASRYVMLLHLPTGHSAEEVEKAMTSATKTLPETLWKSLTWDQGKEMANHAQISVATGLDIYFCDPAKPWQRGSNENTNGLLRQYFPKGTDLSVHSPVQLELVAAQMNRRPRKTLGWVRPSHALWQLFSESSRQPPVASTD
ncbi:MAG: IS30 family transposase [Candidatus Dormibacteraceae bacterium]